MTLESRVESQINTKDFKKSIIYIDTLPKSIGFTIGTMISGGDPEVGIYLALKLNAISHKIKKCKYGIKN